LRYKAIIYRNITDSLSDVLSACARFGYELEEENRERGRRMMQGNYFTGVMDEIIINDIKQIWLDPAIQKTVTRASEFQYLDSTGYFMENIARITTPGYIPINSDILHSRSTTCGIVETSFKVDSLRFRMCDVAGQRSERRKWMHCFSDTRAVLVIVGINEYDQVLAEQNEVNRMHEALKLFADICNSRWFENTTMILFLNKMDLFAEKIKRVPLSVCFPDYTGPNNFESATQFIAQKFVAANKSPNKHIYTHLTCTTDTECIKYIFSSVMDSIINDRIALAE